MSTKRMPINPKRMVVFIYFGFFEDFFEDRRGVEVELLSPMMVIPTMSSVFV